MTYAAWRGLMAVALAALLMSARVASSDGEQGKNWFGEIDRGDRLLWAEDDGEQVADISPAPGRDGKPDALQFVFKQARSLAMTNRKNPTVLKSEPRERQFILSYWLKTETDYQTGDASLCYIRMQTPNFVGAGVNYPRARFGYLDDWTHVGMVFKLNKDALIGSMQFRLSATQPGLRLWIDDPFFTEVTDLPPATVGELLGAATFKPQQTLPLRPELVDQTPPVKGNKAWNTGFEAVADGMWGLPAHRMAATDFTTNNPHSGAMALVLRGGTLGHPAVPVTIYKQHTFSVYARRLDPAQAASVAISMASSGGAYQYAQRAGIAGGEWQRIAVTNILMPVPSRHYSLRITGRNVVLDDAQFEEGEVSPYAPRGGVDAALAMDARAYIYDWGQSPALHVTLANTTDSARPGKAVVRVWNIFDQIAHSEPLAFELKPGERLERTLALPATLRGAFCADLVLDDTVLAERVFSVLPTPRDMPAEQSMLGDHLNFTDFNLWAAHRLGTRWTRSHDGLTKIFKMYLVNPKPDEWRWNQPFGASVGPDDAVKLARKHSVKILGLLDEPPGWAVGLPDQGRCRDHYPEDWTGWLTYVRTIVTRYKDDIDTWELYNEPSHLEKYVELCVRTYPVFKEVLPKGRLFGLSSTPITVMFSGFHERGGHEHLDGIATHIYAWSPNGNLGANFRKVTETYRRDGKPMPHWMTEGNFGGTRGMMFRSHPRYNASRSDVSSVARYLTVARANGVGKVFYYWSNYPSPNPQTTISGNGWSFYHSDTSITAAGAAWAVWGKMIDGTEPLAVIVDRDEEVYLFRDGTELVAAAWAETPRNVTLPGGLFAAAAGGTRFDVMGNPTHVDLAQPHEVTLTQFPCYFRFRGAQPEQVSAYFRKGLGLPDDWQIRTESGLIKEEDAFRDAAGSP